MSDRHDALEELTAEVRRLIEATVATGEEADGLRDVAKEVARLADRLEADLDEDPWKERSYGPGVADFGRMMGINAVTGKANPIAPEVELHINEDRTVEGTVTFGLAHVGPPERVHGGMVAAFLDQALGSATIAAGLPGYTATLTVKYRQATPLQQPLRWEASAEPGTGRRNHARGAIYDAEGRVTAEAEALFAKARGTTTDE
jgi:acyl-coenzyme A thioesterase PaaI-like protein